MNSTDITSSTDITGSTNTDITSSTDNAKKCCKKPTCKPKENKCKSNNVEIYNDPRFWKFLIFLNVLIILIRYSYINCKDKNFSLFWFLVWLELQIIFFYIVVFTFYFIQNAVLYLIELEFYYLKALASVRKPNKIMKFLDLKKTDEALFRIYCILALIIIPLIILFIVVPYVLFFGVLLFFLLGYTKI